METMAFGMLSVISLIISGFCLYHKKPFRGLLSSIITTLLILWTGYCWRLMLISSGKDTALLGFARYPAAPIILCIVAFLAAAGVIISVVRIAQKHRK